MELPPVESEADKSEPKVSERQNIEKILERLKRLEMNDIPDINVDDETVKSLLGNLYMEMLFPHNDRDTFLGMAAVGNQSSFDKRA